MYKVIVTGENYHKVHYYETEQSFQNHGKKQIEKMKKFYKVKVFKTDTNWKEI